MTQEIDAKQIEELAEAIARRDILCCQSSLVELCLGNGTFDAGEIDNYYPDPSDWSAEQCLEWLNEHLTGLWDDETVDGLRDLVRDFAEPNEVYEWWAITGDLCEALREIGEPVIDNDYGYWWGRTCSGQMILADGTLQKVAEKYLRAA